MAVFIRFYKAVGNKKRILGKNSFTISQIKPFFNNEVF